jgi:hypothetical protein
MACGSPSRKMISANEDAENRPVIELFKCLIDSGHFECENKKKSWYSCAREESAPDLNFAT